jgi:predicted enzyme related to lactoylglutathione lyase
MSIAFKGLRTCIYRVNDITKATAWYSKVLGFEPYFNEPFYVGFNVAGYELGLQPDDSNEPKAATVITYWGVDDVAKSFNNLIALGATAFEEPAEVGEGIVVGAVKDPWGNIFGIIYNPTFILK